MIGNGNGVSFRDDENALKLDDGYGCPFVLWKRWENSSLSFQVYWSKLTKGFLVGEEAYKVANVQNGGKNTA